MNPFLISTNTDQIQTQQEALNATVVYFQGIYNALKAIGITPTIAEVNNLAQLTRSKNGVVGFEQSYVTSKLITIAGNVNFNGVAIDPAKLQDLITIPDLTALKAALNNGVNNPSAIAYLQLVNDIIGKTATADDSIVQGNTFYTLLDASTTLAVNLQSVCDTLNAFDAANGDRFKNAVYSSCGSITQGANPFFDRNVKILTRSQVLAGVLPGLDFNAGVFCVSLPFIRAYESALNLG